MFRVNLTISKIAQEKRPAFWSGVFVCGFRIHSTRERKSTGVTEEFWQIAIS
jgi:hypothetical protein